MTADLTPLSKEQRKELESKNVSDSIRYLDSEGFARADIARILGKRYQHVRNVLVQSSATGAPRKKIQIIVNGRLFEDFEYKAKKLGLQPDNYFNEVLQQALIELENGQPNSESTAALIYNYYRPEGEYEILDPVEGNTIGVFNLERPLLDEMYSLCESKRISIEFLLEGILEVSNYALSAARETIDSPIAHCKAMGVGLCSKFVLSDTEADELREKIMEDTYLIQAVAEIKNISINAASLSLSKLDGNEQQKLKQHVDIRSILDRLRSTPHGEVNLEDMLPDE